MNFHSKFTTFLQAVSIVRSTDMLQMALSSTIESLTAG